MFGRRSFPKGRRPSARRPVMNEKREFQRSESFAAAALLALSGGLLDAYTYLCRGGVFANAQTGNMVLLAIRAAEGKWQEAGRYLIPILAFGRRRDGGGNGEAAAPQCRRLSLAAYGAGAGNCAAGRSGLCAAGHLGQRGECGGVLCLCAAGGGIPQGPMDTPLHPPCAPAICAAARRRCIAASQNRRRAACARPDVTLPSLPASSAVRRWAACCCPFWASGRCWWPLRSRPWCLCGCGFDKIKKVSEKSFRNLNCVV